MSTDCSGEAYQGARQGASGACPDDGTGSGGDPVNENPVYTVIRDGNNNFNDNVHAVMACAA